MIELSNGFKLPNIGMGTWPLKGMEMERVMEDALDVGIRLFDTADNYGNEESIGNVLKRHANNRSQIFIMTKISDEKKEGFPWSSIGKYFYKNSSYMKTHTAKDVVKMLAAQSLDKLQTDYIDCLILHWPYPEYLLEIWEAMLELYASGVCKSIGVSNCRERHLEKIATTFSTQPMVNQICITPLDTKSTLLDYHKVHSIQTIGYAPLKCIHNSRIKKSQEINRLCDKYGVGMGELVLAWHSKLHSIPIPMSRNPQRMQTNIEAMNISLTDEEMSLISSLNCNLQYLPESLYCPGI